MGALAAICKNCCQYKGDGGKIDSLNTYETRGCCPRIYTMKLTTDNVIAYVKANPGCMSKDIAKALGVPTYTVNRSMPGYPGIYKIKEISSVNYRHYYSPPEYESDSDGVINDCDSPPIP